jgi:hypothetical protein
MGQPFHVPAGATIRFGAPAHPLPADVREKITTGLFSIEGIAEAHLPLCQVLGTMPEPAQILVVVLKPSTSLESTMPSVMALVGAVLPKNMHLDIWPFVPNDSLLACVRKANCCLLKAAKPEQR